MLLKKTNKFFFSPTLLLGIICFILTGILFFTQKKQSVSSYQIAQAKPSISTTITPTVTPETPANIIITEIINPTGTPIPTQTTTTTTTTTTNGTSAQTFSLSINEPDGNSTYAITFRNGMNACDSLVEAKNEGKIKSLTIDNSYQSAMGSAYVLEINGYRNNWTFTANGQSPQGCSLYHLSQGDTIVWKYD